MSDQRELHIHALADMVLVFHFGLGQGGAARDAPIDRLLAAIDEALLDDVGEQAQFVRLVFLGERQVRVVPVPEHAEPLELGALDIDVLAGVGLARLADGGRVRGGIARLAHVLADLELDRQPVAIPARDIGRAEAAQGLVLDDDVFENLVQGRADMHVAVGKGRAIVQDKLLRAGTLGLDGGIKPGGLPLLQPRRFPRDQVRLHREIGLRQV